MRKHSSKQSRFLLVKNTPLRITCAVLSLVGLGFFLAPLSIGIINIGNGFGIILCSLFAVFFIWNASVSKLLARAWQARVGKWILRVVFVLMVLGGILVIVLSICMIRASADPSNHPQTVIVLGCKVNGSTPSLMLVRRLNVAYEYLIKNETSVVIVTGGQGADEDISEAAAMNTYLLQKGIAAERIYTDDRSTSTYENLRNAQIIMQANGLGNSAVIATDGFHQLRAQMIADELGLETQGLSAQTPAWLTPTYWVREWFGVTNQFLFPETPGTVGPEDGSAADIDDTADVSATDSAAPSNLFVTGTPTPQGSNQTETTAVPVTSTPSPTPTPTPTPTPKTQASDVDALRAGAIVDVSGMSSEKQQACFYAETISDAVFERMDGKSFKSDGQTLRSDLRYIRVLHYGIDGNVHVGELVMHRKLADDMVDILWELYEAKYVIEKMILIDEYITSDDSTLEENNTADDLSMADNNTSAFNYRIVSGTTKLSKHAMGLAIDVNPFYNPWVHTLDGVVLTEPETGALYADRTLDCDYIIDHDDLFYKLLIEHGYVWGGDWSTSKDYQHFQKTV
jgi:uncharacterized SAM-binding protein YcdF (DUF218 family)